MALWQGTLARIAALRLVLTVGLLRLAATCGYGLAALGRPGATRIPVG